MVTVSTAIIGDVALVEPMNARQRPSQWSKDQPTAGVAVRLTVLTVMASYCWVGHWLPDEVVLEHSLSVAPLTISVIVPSPTTLVRIEN